MYDDTKLPSKWIEAELTQIALIVMGQSPDSSTYNERNIGLPFFQGKAEFGNVYPIAKKYCSSPIKIAEPNDILISVRAPVGPTNICIEKSCIGRGLAAIRVYDDIAYKYIFYFLRYIEHWLKKQGSGTTFKAITKGILEKIVVPVPPRKEQKRIAEKIDELFAEIDYIYEHLDKIPNIIENFRQSILERAISGKLTENWRATYLSDKNRKNVLFKKMSFRQTIVKEWSYVTINDIQNFIGSGSTPRGGKDVYLKSGIRFLRSQNVYPDGLRLNDVVFISQYINNKMKRTQIKDGDVLLNITGASIGRSTYIPDNFGSANINQHVCIIRPNEKIIPGFLSIFLNSPYGQETIQSIQQGVTRQALNLSQIKNIWLPLPSIEEQKEIVAYVEKLMEFAGDIKKQHQKAKNRANSMPQAILEKAFRGKLVPQYSNDEPVNIIGANIRQEKKRKSENSERAYRMEKKPKKSLKDVINDNFSATFTFEQLQNLLNWNYEELKEKLFELLSEKNSPIKQKFDEKLGKIIFRRN